MSQILWIARHGNRLDFVYPEWFNTAKRRYDPPLSEDGLIQAQQLAKRLESEEIHHIFVSPFLRAIQTAYPLAEILNLPLKIEAGFSEWLNPHWMTYPPETRSLDELKVEYNLLDETYQSRGISQYPESEETLYQRTGETLVKLMAEFSDNLLIVGHSATLMGTAQRLFGKGTAIKTPLCGLIQIIEQEQTWQLILKGDTEHLK